jgi:hypothetical protein
LVAVMVMSPERVVAWTIALVVAWMVMAPLVVSAVSFGPWKSATMMLPLTDFAVSSPVRMPSLMAPLVVRAMTRSAVVIAMVPEWW